MAQRSSAVRLALLFTAPLYGALHLPLSAFEKFGHLPLWAKLAACFAAALPIALAATRKTPDQTEAEAEGQKRKGRKKNKPDNAPPPVKKAVIPRFWDNEQSGTVFQNALLLIFSYYLLCCFNYRFAIILGCYTVALYGFARLIVFSSRPGFWLAASIVCAAINLGVFKYFDFFRDSLMALGINPPVAEIIMPIGVSFYTFHSITLLVSLRRREVDLPNPLNFALFPAFFPSLIAGPINRAKDFLPQLAPCEPRRPLEVQRAFCLIVLAAIKVLWLDSALDQYVSAPIFANPAEFHSLDLLIGLYAISIQIYLNFSGYTDMVTGVALLLGFRLPVNFNMPYVATNLRHFWERWHMSLSGWIRDYVYIPLGGGRSGFLRMQVNLMAAMLISGFWHGASYNFIIWGALHGIGVVFLNFGDRIFGRDALAKKAGWLARLVTFHYVTFAWIFFFSPTVGDAEVFISSLFGNFDDRRLALNAPLYLGALLVLYLAYPWLARAPKLYQDALERMNPVFAPLVLALTVWLTVSLAPPGIPGFIYASF